MTWPEAFAYVGFTALIVAAFCFIMYTSMRETEACCRMVEKLSEPQTYTYEETKDE